jgi:FKBP-type peptidyl-prolyl cis-trans isomerase FklB
MAKQQVKMQEAGEKNKTDGEAFLAANKTKPGVITLPDGLQYKIVKPGAGESPADKDKVTVNYEGTLINGQVFDSSYARGKPFTFQVSEVIPGWAEAVKKMKPGAEWMVYIPPALGYGEHGAGPIGPNQTLIFKVELIAVQPQSASKTDTAANSDSKK